MTTILLLFKVTVLLLATLAGAWLLRGAPAAARHRFWTNVFAALLVLPLLALAGPTWQVPLPDRVAALRDAAAPVPNPTITARPARNESSAPRRSDNAETVVTLDPASTRMLRTPLSSRLSIARLIVLTWLVGAAAAAAALTVSLLRVRWLARSADPALIPAWHCAAEQVASRLGLRHAPRLLLSPAVTTPMAAGVFRPTIFLPISSRSWTREQRDVVLAHEIAHLVARDPLRHVLARVAMACYWFHPLAWLAAREAERAREHACDEAVLALGTKPSAYARVLLDLAESLAGVPALRGALPMIEPSMLEKRLMTILTTELRPRPRGLFMLPAAGVAVLTMTVAAAQPAVSAPPIPATAHVDATVQPPQVDPLPAQPAVLATLTGARPTPTAASALAQNLVSDTVCDSLMPRGSFSGNMSMDDRGGRRVIYEQIGVSGADRIIQKRFDDLRVCMIAEGAGGFSSPERPSEWFDRANRVVMMTARGNLVHELEIIGQPGATRRMTWRVRGANTAINQATDRWRTELLAVLDTTWELSSLHGQVSSLRGEISSIHGHRSSLQGEISSLSGEISSMRGQIASYRGEGSSLRGEISSIRGHASSLRGAISSERGAISSLDAGGYSNDRADAARATLLDAHRKEIARLEREISDFNEEARIAAVEKRIAALNVEKKVAEIEARIKAFDVEGKVAAIERQISGLDVDGKVRAIERQIDALDVDRRGRQLSDRQQAELKRLEAAISAVK